MLAEFNNNWEEDDKIKTAATLQSVIDKRNTAQKTLEEYQDGCITVRDRKTDADIAEVGADGDDDNEKDTGRGLEPPMTGKYRLE